MAAAFAALLVSADGSFTRLVIEPKHARMAADFLDRLYSHDNCALDDYSQITRYGSQLLDYEEIEQAFLKKWEAEKHGQGDERGLFSRMIFALHITRVVRREDLAEQTGSSVESVKRVVRLLKRFNLIDTTRDDYVKKPKFNKFLRRFSREHRDFFEHAASGGGQVQDPGNQLGDKGLWEEEL